MTNGWVDIKNADVILAMGGNPAENHPVGFKWFIEAKLGRNAKLVVVDPRFTRTAAVADLYSPIRAGTDIAYLCGILRYALKTGRYHEDYVKIHTNASFLVNPAFAFSEGLFSGFDEAQREYDKDTWTYQAGRDGFARRDPTLQDPRCVLQLLKKHVERYTPEMVERICGTPKDLFLKVAEVVTSTGNAERVGTITYALGWTQHSTGVQMIRTAAILQLLLGNVGRPGGGVNAFRGHSNIQGATDTAGNFEILPGYLKTPIAERQTLKQYMESNIDKPMQHESMNYWQNYPKFMVSLLKAAYGKAATKENEFGYSWLPKVDGNYSWMYIFDDMYRASSTRAGGEEPGPEGFITFGMNPVGLGPNSKKMVAALSKLKWAVVVENVETETAIFWKAPKEYEGPDPSQIPTEVFLLPAADFAEKDGTFTNSARWLQWKWKAADPPGQARADQEILARIFLAVRDLYAREGGALPEQVLNVDWTYPDPIRPDLAEVLKEMSGKALADVRDPNDPTRVIKAGQQLDGFGQLMDDGSTMCGNWLHSGVYTQAGNNAQRRDDADPTGLGMFHGWAFSWPANRRVMYNRASADAAGKPWDPQRAGIAWNGQKWVGDVPDTKPDAPPGTYGAFIMMPEGVARLFAGTFNDGPFPEHYEPVESPTKNLLSKQQMNPVAKIWNVPDQKNDLAAVGSPDYPYVITTYRLTEHHLSGVMSRYLPMLAELFHSHFAEISHELAGELGIANGERVTVMTPRGKIHVTAMVTHRLKPFMIDGKKTHQIGVPWHWGYNGISKGDITNDLSATVGDPTVYIQETKAFLCNVKKGEV